MREEEIRFSYLQIHRRCSIGYCRIMKQIMMNFQTDLKIEPFRKMSLSQELLSLMSPQIYTWLLKHFMSTNFKENCFIFIKSYFPYIIFLWTCTWHRYLANGLRGGCGWRRVTWLTPLPIKDWGRISVGLSEHLYAPEIVSWLNQPGSASIRRRWPWILAVKPLKNCLDLWCRAPMPITCS